MIPSKKCGNVGYGRKAGTGTLGLLAQYAYLDTLAEVHFQQGDRKRAVELSEKAVKLSGSDFLLDHQLQRFKHDQPISELLAE